MKHLHSLEVFTTGHSMIPLESTAIQNFKDVLESEATDSYSQVPNLFLIFNLNRDKLITMLDIKNVRCILNTNEKVADLAPNSDFIFYNKKTKSFLNYDINAIDLEFERHIIATSKNEIMLQDKIQKIKTKATRIFTELNQNGNLNNLEKILKGYDSKYWDKILKFVELYYKINVPTPKTTTTTKAPKKESLFDYSNEYELIMTSNKKVAQEFVQLLHDFRSRRVNPSHLDLNQLYYPEKLYTYLRNHHWSDGISEEFLKDWINMKMTGRELSDADLTDFETLFKDLKLPTELLLNSMDNGQISQENSQENGDVIINSSEIEPAQIETIEEVGVDSMPSVQNFSQFKRWMLNMINKIEGLTHSQFSRDNCGLYTEKVEEINIDAEESYSEGRFSEFIRLKYLMSEKMIDILYEKVFRKIPQRSDEFKTSQIVEEIQQELGIDLQIMKDLNYYRKIRNNFAHYHTKFDKQVADIAANFFNFLCTQLESVY